jgi:hypothetical protein
MPEPRDPTDDRIRALLAEAVASAPPPPTVDEVRDRGLPPVRVAVAVEPSGTAPRRRPPRSGTARTLRAVVAYAAVIVLVLAGVRAIDRRGDDDRTVMPADALPVRYVPTDVPSGLELADAELGPAPDLRPSPEVGVYERDDGVRVRIAAGPPDWADRAAGLGSRGAQPESTTTTALATSTTTTGPTTTGPSAASGSTTTTLGPMPGVAGLPARPDIAAETVRGGTGGVETHDPTTTTVWFEDQGRLVAVDVYGLDRSGALGIVDRLTVDAGGRLVPAPADALRRVAETEPETEAETASAGAEPPAMARLVYTAADGRDGGPAFVVTTVRLRPGAADLLTATAGSFGRIARWGERQVLVDDGLDNGATTLVSFVDPAGVLVTVLVSALGPTDDLAPYVDGLVPADERLWGRVAAE